MNPKPQSLTLFFCFAVILVILLLLVLWRCRQPSVSPARVQTSSNKTPARNAMTVVAAENTLSAATQVPAEPRTKSQMIIEGLTTLNHRLINFYGQVLDQDGKPLSNVEVRGAVGINTGMVADGKSYYATTDEQGLFRFEGLKGVGITIYLKKPGYNFASNRRNFLYSLIDPDNKRHLPDRNAPVVFTMWQSMGAEPLIHYYGRSFETTADGIPMRIDLAQAKKVSDGGDLMFQFSRGSDSMGNSQFPDWTLTVTAVDGGLIEGDWGSQRFISPEIGYQPFIKYITKGDAKKWDIDQEIYFKSHNGRHYGRVEVSAYFGASKCRIALRVWMNPNGSRNLEFDPAKAITPPQQ